MTLSALVLTVSLLAVGHPPVPCPHPKRDPKQVAAFVRTHPCPAGSDKGSKRRCRGHVVDHVCPLACCGLDAPENMKWQTTAEAKRKDRWELQCSRSCRGWGSW